MLIVGVLLITVARSTKPLQVENNLFCSYANFFGKIDFAIYEMVSFSGINQHIFQCKTEREERSGQEDTKDDIPRPFFRSLFLECEQQSDSELHKFVMLDSDP
jgi:hypothetical protein